MVYWIWKEPEGMGREVRANNLFASHCAFRNVDIFPGATPCSDYLLPNNYDLWLGPVWGTHYVTEQTLTFRFYYLLGIGDICLCHWISRRPACATSYAPKIACACLKVTLPLSHRCPVGLCFFFRILYNTDALVLMCTNLNLCDMWLCEDWIFKLGPGARHSIMLAIFTHSPGVFFPVWHSQSPLLILRLWSGVAAR